MNRDERLRSIVEALCAAFGRDPTPPLFAAWDAATSDLDIDDVRAGAAELVRTSERMPVPAQLRRMLAGGSADVIAEQRWAALVQAIGRIGAYDSVSFDDPIVTASIRSMGGWSRLCRREGDDFYVWAKREFLRAYTALSGARLGPDQVAPLPGLIEVENSGRYQVEPPRKHVALDPPAEKPALQAGG